VLYDQTFAVAFADPIFQSAIGAAEMVLTGAGAVAILGPTLLSSANTTSSTTNTVQTGSMVTGTSVNVTTYIGPLTINVGDFGVCQSYPPPTGCTGGTDTPLAIPPGGSVTDTFVLSLVDIFKTTTTTNTDLLTQDYNLIGVPAAAVPEPSTWALFAGGLLGMAWLRRSAHLIKSSAPRGSAAG
jgi:hypothetical protein